MRKDKKQLLINIIRSLYEAHESIRKLHKSGDIDVVRSLLGDCQEAVLSIGDAIIDSETEDCVTIRYIQDYCESIFNIHQSISENTDIKEVEKTLNHDLTLIKKSIEKDIKVRLEVVFLPYKASMWDSLESVWKAADEDPECDAYVVPIPYYDRNPDHSFGEFHYEGGEYPDYVPVTHYNNYDISKRRPDVIYIHNPYDDCNYVTSVDPRFYSRELKKYTDKLVYIPYFVLGEINPDDENALENIAHFVLPPGVINADEVIVQSENMKKAYVNVLLSKCGNTAENKKKFEKKIMGIGSPKFDKIANMSKNDVKIPDEWKGILYKLDGTRKKVVFYNNSVSALLKNDVMMIEKMRSVFNIFFEYRDEVALLWRPHPLIKATIESMRPDLWKDYNILVEQYIGAEWGIYDDTADLYRAIALCDGYYGDPSSVDKLCRKVGIPVMFQCVSDEIDCICNNDKTQKFSLTLQVIKEDNIRTLAYFCDNIKSFERDKNSLSNNTGSKIYLYSKKSSQ
ncbi:MAG: hypothetical protein PUE12_15305 [Oscillospiraceae bacterium]|nr:hypothetical protein [Oscillospiraceae bacterium]